MSAATRQSSGGRFTAAVVLVGHAGPAATQLLIFALLGQAFGPNVLGSYVLALAVATPVFVLFGLSLRMLYMTSETVWSVAWFFRSAVVVAALCSAIAITLQVVLGVGLLLALAVAAGRAFDLVQLAGLGVLQRHDRLRFGSLLLIGNATLSCALAGSLAVSTSAPAVVVAGSVLGSAAFAIVTWGSIRRRHRDAAHTRGSLPVLIRRGFPLGLSVGMLTLTISLPAYALDATGDLAAVAVYGILSNLRTAMNLVYGTVAQIFLTPFASAARARDARLLRRAVMRAFSLTTVAGASVSLLLIVAGPALIPRVFGVDTENWTLLLTIVAFGFVAAGAIYVLDAALSALLKFHQQAWTAALSLVATIAFLFLTYSHLDVLVASIALTAAFGLSALLKGLVFITSTTERAS